MMAGCEKIPLLHYSYAQNYGEQTAHYLLEGAPGPLYEWHDLDVWSDQDGTYFASKDFCSKLWFRTCSRAKKQILNEAYGFAKPGGLLAVLGGSGAGKTTLLDTLAYRGRNLVSDSAVRTLDGRHVTQQELKRVCAYVQQHDLFLGSLTPREHLLFQAQLRLGKDWSRTQKMGRVNEVIAQFSLERCQHTAIGLPGLKRGLSGGERKRLSLASECLRDPALMVCDEPITGLDAPMALGIARILKELTRKGKTIIASFHQPSHEIFKMFDQILIMTHGEVTFFGTPLEAKLFFDSIGYFCPRDENPAEIYIEAVTEGKQQAAYIQGAYEQYKKNKIFPDSSYPHEDSSDSILFADGSNDQIAWTTQFDAITRRAWRCALKEPLLIRVRLVQTIIISLLIGAIGFAQDLDQDGIVNINGALFIFLTNITFQHIFAVINVFCSELPIFLRERRSGLYRTSAYFLGKTVAELPFCCIGAMLFTVIAYPLIMVKQLQFVAFSTTVAIMVLVANVSASFGYFISSISSSIDMALSVGPPMIIPFLLFGGFFLNSGSVPKLIQWISYASWFHYGNEALLITQWSRYHNYTIACIDDAQNPSDYKSTCLRNGNAVLKSLGFSEYFFLWDLLGLLLLAALFRMMAFCALSWRSRDHC